MKNSSTYEKRFKSLLSRLRKIYSPPTPAPPLADPTEELIWSVLLEDAAEGTAKVALSRLTGHFVDFNELRVSRVDEIVDILPNTLSDRAVRADRLIRALQTIFDKFDTLVITELREHGKREARNFVASIPQVTAFIEGRVCLLALGIHAIPADRTLMDLLRDRGVVHPETDVRDTQGFLERIVPAKDVVEVALLLEAFRQQPDKLPGGKSSAKPDRPVKAAAKPGAAAKPSPDTARKTAPADTKAAGKKK